MKKKFFDSFALLKLFSIEIYNLKKNKYVRILLLTIHGR